MEPHFGNSRLSALRSLMEKKGWDAVVLTGSDPHSSEYPARRWKQVEWLTGFSGEAGDVVVTASHAGLWTDSRYFIAAQQVLPAAGFELHKTRLPDSVDIPAWLAAEAGENFTLAVDSMTLSLEAVNAIRRAVSAEGFEIVSAPDLIDEIWEGRPPIPSGPIVTMDTKYSGESRLSKICRIRSFMRDNGCDSMLIGGLDEIAWTLNVRGNDIEYCPVVISYLLVTQEDTFWYVRRPGHRDPSTLASFAELSEDGISVLPYEDLTSDFRALQRDRRLGRLFADPATLNYEIALTLEQSGADTLFGESPVQIWKAVKNEVELRGMREAHLRDGIAMEKFLFWLEEMTGIDERVSEWTAVRALHALKAKSPEYRGESFETISAYGKGAALPHYVTPRENAPMLFPSGLYLNDSGSQYIDGTTDITRTTPLGPCSPLEMEDYTLVLKGHIDLAMAVFPKGTCGCHLDVLARNPLWRSKRNFGHGTGHGVGHWLCVHEGPHSIRQNTLGCPLQPGMVVTNEPGIYREGMHGVRHENVMVVVSEGSNDFGRWYRFEPLTLCHFDTSVLVRELLTQDEIKWLNAYNAMVYERLALHLPPKIAEWLKEKTKAI
ncbi:MAG: aminopeptidase P family protein [Bacteroidales bacterium]|nr:aminopeptidase P family protein [Bacteroidales bacterium]